jgi:hypothetical protein
VRRLVTLAVVIAAAALNVLGQAAGFTITTTSLPTAIFGQPYTPVLLQTANDPGPVVWSIVPAGAGPAGFVVGPPPVGQPGTNGTFCYGFTTQSGAPNCAGSVQSIPGVYSFSLQATSLSTNQTATQQFTVAVVQPLQITTLTVPDAAANQPYAFQILATGGTGQFAWSVVKGALPPGIGLDPAMGVLAGTAPNVTSSYTFTIQLLDQVTQVSVTRQYTINVLGGIGITTSSLPDANVNVPYSFQLKASGGAGFIWSVPAGSQLPQNFTLSTSGLLTGFGLNTGIFGFTIQIMDPETQVVASRNFTLNITLGPLLIVETTLPNANQNVAYRATLHASGGIPPYRWSFDIASPQGLSINATTGAIAGTPPTAGLFGIPVSLRDATGTVFSVSLPLNVFPAVSISTASLPNGSPGTPYAAALSATGGALPYTWSVSVGNLPTGLNLNAANGQIAGNPSAQGAFQFTIQVTDFGGSIATKVFTITIGAGQALTITTASLPDGTLNQPYSQGVAATGGTSPFSWSIASGALPAGLQLNAASGVISGTPTTVGNSSFIILVTDSLQNVARKSLSINIANPANPVVVTSGNFNGTVLSAFSQTLTASGGTSPYTWSVTSGTLPSGLQLNSATGVISGTPSAPGTSQITFTATDANNQTGSKIISITIALPPPPVTSISVGSSTQPAVGLSTGAPYPVDITGVLTLTFASSVGSPDGMETRFSNGTRSLQFTVPANTTQASFSGAPNPAVMTGTVAGTITLTASMSAGGQNITSSPAPTQTIPIVAAVPVINTVTLQQVSGGVSVVVTGYSNTREVSSGSFTFAVSSGNTLSNSQITVPLTSAYTTWYSNAASNATGGQFKLTVPFTVTGSATAITKVTVTLTNSKGASAAVSSP